MNFRLSPTWRLTGWYVLIIMVISLMFSTIIYQLTVVQLRQSLPNRLRFETDFAPRFNLPFDQHIADYFEQQYESVVATVRLRLIVLNLAVLAASSVVSYYLAKRTLRPIEQSLNDQRHFTADASHELRTPLAAMKAEIEVALKGKDTAEHRRALESGLEEITKLEQLSTSLLHLARHEEERQQTRYEPIELPELAELAWARVKVKAEAKKITLERDGLRGVVTGSPAHLTDLLVILLDNAIKYSPPSSVVRLHARWNQQQVMLSVVDAGTGIPPDDLPHVFKRFYRADPSRAKTKADGFGLGLAIAKQIVERHHGQISIDSTVGHGTTVNVTLPQV